MNWLFVGPIAGLVWLLACWPIYKPASMRELFGVWFKTGCALLIMYGIAELVEDAADYMVQRSSQGMELWQMAVLLTVLVGGFFFTWKALVRDDKTVGRSVFEFALSVSIMNYFGIFEAFDGTSSVLVVAMFIGFMMTVSKILDLAKQRWIAQRDSAARQRIGLLINAAFVGPFVATPLLWIVSVSNPGLEQALGPLNGWTVMHLYVDATAFLLEAV